MKIFLSKVVYRIFRLFRINKLMPIFYKSKTVKIDEESAKQARDILEEASPNPKTSCITQNTIEPQADVHIIVPAYNVEKYIKECIDSVVLPPKKYTWHLTIINDGSTDKTGEILRAYENIENIEIITQENKGFSGARNAGLKHIKGKYITFLDSDDYLSWEGIEALLDCAISNAAEIVEGGFTRIGGGGEIIRMESHKEGKIGRRQLLGQPWAKIFRADLFAKTCFPEKYWYEDSILAQIIYPQTTSCYGVNKNCYYYRRNTNSITYTALKKSKAIDSFWITEQLYKERKRIGLSSTQEYYEYILRMVKLTYSRVQYQSKAIQETILILFVSFIKENFSDYSTQVSVLKPIEKAIQNNDIGKLKGYCKWM